MAIKEIRAMTKAINGKAGYTGTLKGLLSWGSFFLKASSDAIDIMYSVNAPKTEIVIISEVLPLSSATIPIAILISNALAGV